MKLVNTQDSSELDIKKYPMPVKGVAGSANINGEDVVTMFTSGRGNSYTYFRLANVDLYVAGALDAEVPYTVELPEGFGADEAPAPRKSYYVRKRPAKDGEGEVPLGASTSPDGVLAETGEDGTRQITETGEDDGSTDADGEEVDEQASEAAVPAKSRRRAK
jgi:hypothetical protein